MELTILLAVMHIARLTPDPGLPQRWCGLIGSRGLHGNQHGGAVAAGFVYGLSPFRPISVMNPAQGRFQGAIFPRMLQRRGYFNTFLIRWRKSALESGHRTTYE